MDIYKKCIHTCEYKHFFIAKTIPCFNCIFSKQDTEVQECSCFNIKVPEKICNHCEENKWYLKDLIEQRVDYYDQLNNQLKPDNSILTKISDINISILLVKKAIMEIKYKDILKIDL